MLSNSTRHASYTLHSGVTTRLARGILSSTPVQELPIQISIKHTPPALKVARLLEGSGRVSAAAQWSALRNAPLVVLSFLYTGYVAAGTTGATHSQVVGRYAPPVRPSGMPVSGQLHLIVHYRFLSGSARLPVPTPGYDAVSVRTLETRHPLDMRCHLAMHFLIITSEFLFLSL